MAPSKVEPNTESDPAGLLVDFLALVGNVIGRGAFWKAEEDFHYCKLNMVMVGETSKGRKGTAQNRLNRIMNRVDPEWYSNCVTTGLSSGEGVVHRVRDKVISEDKDGEPKVIDEGVSDKRLLVEEPEFASTLTVMRREGNTLSMVVRNLWDDRVLQIMTRNSPEKSTLSHGTIIGHITRNELIRHLTEEKLGSGIANRFLFVLVKRSRVLPFGGGEDPITDEHVKRLKQAIEFGKRPRHIEFARDIEDGVSARDLWEEVYPALSEGKLGLFGAVVSRAEAQVRRLATVYAVLDCSEEVRCSHLLAALAVWQHAEESAYYIFGDRTGDELADLLHEELKAASPDGLTRTQISELFSRHVKATRIRAALRTLEDSGKARMERQMTGERGAPTERWYARDE